MPSSAHLLQRGQVQNKQPLPRPLMGKCWNLQPRLSRVRESRPITLARVCMAVSRSTALHAHRAHRALFWTASGVTSLSQAVANHHILRTSNERLMIHFNLHFKRKSLFRTGDVACLVYPNTHHPVQEYWLAATLSLRTLANSPILFKTQATSVRKAITSEGFIIIQMRLHYSDMDKGHCQDGSNTNGGAQTACTGCIMHQVLRGF